MYQSTTSVFVSICMYQNYFDTYQQTFCMYQSTTSQLCNHPLGAPYSIGGPIWSDPIHNPESVDQIIKQLYTRRAFFASYLKLNGLLSLVQRELNDCPLFVDVPSAASTVKMSQPSSEAFRSALIHAGYRVSPTHVSETGIKTDAPWSVVWDILRAWIDQTGMQIKTEPGSYQEKILSKKAEG